MSDITIPRGRLPVDMINRILTYKGTVYENRVTMRFKFDQFKYRDGRREAVVFVVLEWDQRIDRSWRTYMEDNIKRCLRDNLNNLWPRFDPKLLIAIYDNRIEFEITGVYHVNVKEEVIRSEFYQYASNPMVKIMKEVFPPPSIPRQPMPLPSNPENNYKLKDTTVYKPDKWNPDKHPVNFKEVEFETDTGYGPGYELTVTFFLVNNKMMAVSKEGVIFPQFRPKLKI